MEKNSTNQPETIFYAFYQKYRMGIFLFAKSLIKDNEDAKDIAGEVIMKVWRGRDKCNTIGNMKSYAFKCAQNACFNYLKQAKLRRRKKDEMSSCANDFEEFDMNLGSIGPEKELLYRAIRALDVKYRESLLLFYIGNMSCGEIGMLFQLSEPTVRYRIRRGKKLLEEAVMSSSDFS